MKIEQSFVMRSWCMQGTVTSVSLRNSNAVQRSAPQQPLPWGVSPSPLSWSMHLLRLLLVDLATPHKCSFEQSIPPVILTGTIKPLRSVNE